MKNELLQTTLAQLADALVDWVATENPDDLGGQAPADAVAALIAGGRAAGGYFEIGQRCSGVHEIVYLGDAGGCVSDPAAVAATVDQAGRVWLRGGSALDAILDASSLW